MAKPKDRISVKRAKELCIARNGRLPRCGYEMTVEKGIETRTIRDLNDQTITGPFPFQTYLQNNGGTYRVWTWYAPYPEYAQYGGPAWCK